MYINNLSLREERRYAGGTVMAQGKVGIIGAMDEEIASIQAAVEITCREVLAGMEFLTGTLGGK